MTISNIVDLSCQIEETCRFCYPQERERIVYETDHFYVMVSLGPIVEGYLLIVSKEHTASCSNISKNHIYEFLELKEKVFTILNDLYSCCIFYEHGKTGNCLIGKDHRHCFHAHLHCVPAKIKMNELVQEDYEGIRYTDYFDFWLKARQYNRYLFVEDSALYTYQPIESIRNQYLRFKLSCAMQCEERWDWVQNQNWPLIYKTIEKIKPQFG